MTSPYCDGYLSALRGVPVWENPWPILLWDQRKAWVAGHLDARLDASPMPVRRVEPEVAGPRPKTMDAA